MGLLQHGQSASTVSACIFVSDIPAPNGKVYSKEVLRKMQADNPDMYEIKEKPDGRVELWTQAPWPAKPLSSKEEPE
jgi:hypothetical protein